MNRNVLRLTNFVLSWIPELLDFLRASV